MDKQNLTEIIKTNQRSPFKIVTTPRIFLLSFLIITLSVLFVTNSFFTSRFSESIKRQGQLNLTKNTSNLLSELQKNSIIPQLLVNDQEITKSLISENFSVLSERFSLFLNELSVASISLLDKYGNLVAFSAKENFEKKIPYKAFTNNANDRLKTVMNVSKKEGNEFGFFYSRLIE